MIQRAILSSVNIKLRSRSNRLCSGQLLSHVFNLKFSSFKMELAAIVKIGFLVLALCYSQAASFAIKSHFEAKTANQNSDNDTLIFAHVVSKAANNLMWNIH